jgi:hypothetical protein
MAEPTFETLLEKTFADIKKRREDLRAQKTQIEQELAACERDYRRYQTAHEALEGRFDQLTKAPRQTRESTGSRAKRGSRDALKEQVVELLRRHPNGLRSGEIADALPDGAKQLPNVLSLMKSDGVLTQEQRRGPYKLAAA